MTSLSITRSSPWLLLASGGEATNSLLLNVHLRRTITPNLSFYSSLTHQARNHMSQQNGPRNSWLEKLIFPIFVAVVAGSSAPWWLSFFSDPTPEPELPSTPEPNSSPTSEPEPPSTPEPDSSPTSESKTIRKQGYIFRLEDCYATGEVGVVVCDFTVETESEQKTLIVIARNTFLVDANGQKYSASRMEFGTTGSPTSARSDLSPGVLTRGSVSFNGLHSDADFFQVFELGGHSLGENNLSVLFREVPLAN